MDFQFQSIGILSTPFKEKFGVPRQSLMMSEAKGLLKLNNEPGYLAALRHLDQFSHVWIVFVFHKSMNKPWHPLIETPRVDAGARMGVFATRSPHRPNPIGMSAVKLESIDFEAKSGIEIHLSGLDLLDGTPVLDIKPYLPYADRIAEANSGWIKTAIERFPVRFSPRSLAVIAAASQHPGLRLLIEQMLELDPRPTSQRKAAPIADPASEGMKFAFRLLDFDVQWVVVEAGILVEDLVELSR
jgi:tRNA-Thr(GGU) m(6)t(6)A37 methyltransferase TsaA